MSDKWTWATAVEFWRQHYRTDAEPVWDRFAAAEAFLLDHVPRSSREADVLFEVLLEQGDDGRGDGRDRRALRRLKAYVHSLHQSLNVAA